MQVSERFAWPSTCTHTERGLSRDSECLRVVRKLSGSRKPRGRRQQRKDGRLKCRFHATLEPRKRLWPLLTYLPVLAPLSRLPHPPTTPFRSTSPRSVFPPFSFPPYGSTRSSSDLLSALQLSRLGYRISSYRSCGPNAEGSTGCEEKRGRRGRK